MASTPPPDPYLALGVSKTATLAEIRSAHRKLVIKCHPDKVQDPTLKAIKQEEFHKVQQAYELLSDDAKRAAYDEQVKLAELRKEMGRSASSPGQGPPPGKTVFDYEVREAAPRPSTFAKSKTKTEPTKVYTRSDSRSYEDDLPSRMYEEPLRTRARKTTSYEEPRRSTREDEKRRRGEEEKLREKMEKEARKSARGSDKKSRDKERRRGTEEKHSTRASALHVTDDDSEELHRQAKAERKSSRRAAEEEIIRQREKEARAAKEAAEKQAILTDRTRKLDRDKEFAAQYMSASRRKAAAAVAESEESFRPKPMRRAETFQDATYSSPRYAGPTTYATVEEEEQSDDEYVRRSSARPSQRRASEQVPAPSRSTRETSRPSNSRKTSTAYDAEKPYIIDAAPPAAAPPLPRMPSHTSAPANLHNMVPPPPGRSRTMPTAYAPPAPSLGRSQTYQAGDASSRSRKSNLKKTVDYISEDSESSRSPSPPPVRRQAEPIRYIISKDSRAVPIPSPRHRSAFKDDDYDINVVRERSQSPRGTPSRRAAERPPLTRSRGSTSKTSRSRSQGYYSTSPSEAVPLKNPIIKEARPKLSTRDSPSSSRTPTTVPYFGEVKYATAYGPEHVMYSPDGYRRGSEPHQYASPRREATYA